MNALKCARPVLSVLLYRRIQIGRTERPSMIKIKFVDGKSKYIFVRVAHAL